MEFQNFSAVIVIVL